MGDGPLPPDLRRRDRQHVLRDRLRPLAAAGGLPAAECAADALATLVVVRRDDGHDAALAPHRPARRAPAHGLLRLQPSGAASSGHHRRHLLDRRLATGGRRLAVHLHPRQRAARCGQARALYLQHSPACERGAQGAEQLRLVDRPDDCVDSRQLRRAHRAAGDDSGNFGAGDSRGSPAMNREGALLAGPVKLALAVLAVLLALSLLVGFLWLPMVKPDFAQGGLWDAICRAAGVPSTWVQPLAKEDPAASRVSMVPALGGNAGGDIGRGGTLAQRCTMCHGARGVSASDVPNLAGQYSEVTYKQLMDYKGGQRRHTLMQALTRGMSDADIRDLAAFYAQLPRPSPAPESVAV